LAVPIVPEESVLVNSFEGNELAVREKQVEIVVVVVIEPRGPQEALPEPVEAGHEIDPRRDVLELHRRRGPGVSGRRLRRLFARSARDGCQQRERDPDTSDGGRRYGRGRRRSHGGRWFAHSVALGAWTLPQGSCPSPIRGDVGTPGILAFPFESRW